MSVQRGQPDDPLQLVGLGPDGLGPGGHAVLVVDRQGGILDPLLELEVQVEVAQLGQRELHRVGLDVVDDGEVHGLHCVAELGQDGFLAGGHQTAGLEVTVQAPAEILRPNSVGMTSSTRR
jgi:hypothetical protein